MTARVLLVDDNDVVRAGLRELLEDYALDVVGEGSNGGEAVDLAVGLDPDVVLMDLRMPVLDGIEAARRIREHAPSVQVVILSAYDDPALREDAARAEVAGYLVKGCSPTLIHEAVMDAWIDRYGTDGLGPASSSHSDGL